MLEWKYNMTGRQRGKVMSSS